ncbi:Cell-division control histidine kinase PdhS [Bosea sp. 62]|uniref:PAS domain-containing sensor histidine kinase n=1 Tax=unclassified Bosea (in: a-proteobacteria) TaxID=2653178 RepID=UPI00125A07A1|nr:MULTISPECIES: PAS domain-containing sensor histidine kinase [unclassified Bosea (in: a-proteobacteria)]CAD5293353.1 Cell-division control histidine kinase PdhS [Bosea sp. 7B]CAD5298544.1 Cell-division control histidine kinase PdhS [Bosea sp. 21B]CAD5298706.1 Cell-division control histidine kinase PdhS [Bosea sp. 46]VVT61490.1 Cell-division control histidine kinase PdhS [Bosea sp. EC-HK365B]VXB13117.1 Cell-division control histidine kinase PdhS [Bosea sp. 127]
MSESGQDWNGLTGALAQDPALAGFARDGALLLWPAGGDAPVFANAGGRALLGTFGGADKLPAATRERLRLLAAGLASPTALRLERLRLGASLAGLVTCGCKRIETGSGLALAIGVTASELRRLGITVPKDEPTAVAAPPPAAPPTTPVMADTVAESPEQPRRANLRFLWESDLDGTLVSLSQDFAALVGPKAASATQGRNWPALLASDIVDLEGDLATRLATSSTWSGRAVLWRVSPGEGARVELSGFPLFDGERNPAGFRGFGLTRSPANEAFPQREAPEEDVASVAPEADIPAAELPVAAVVEAPTPAVPSTEAAEAAPIEPARAEAREDETDGVPANADVTAEASSEPEEAVEAQDAPAEPRASDDDATTEQAEDGGEAAEASEPPPAPEAPPANVVPLRNGHLAAVRPVLEPSKTLLSSAERNAFREIAKALGARIAGEEDEPGGPRLPVAAQLRVREKETSDTKEESSASVPATAAPVPPSASEGRPRIANAHAEILDRLPIAVLVNRDETALYANRTLLDLLDYADLDDLTAAGGVSKLIRGLSHNSDGAMILVDRRGGLISVDGRLSSVSWQGEAATLMAFRNSVPGGDLKMLTPEEAEEQELAAEFAAEEEEATSRVEQLRLEGQANDARVSELSAMLDTATDGVVTVDGRGRILSLNKSAEALFGYDQREVAGELFTLLFAPESHSPALDYLDGLIGGGVASLMNDGREVIGRVRQGGRIPLFMTMGRIAEGPDSKFCAVLRDITAWKKTEGELVEARKTAEKASAQKSDVLAKISHEIRTPLNAIIGFAEVMAEERFGPIENERYKEYLRDIHLSGGYVISLVNDLLDLAKIEAGKLDLDFGSVNLNDIALSAVNLLQPEAQRGRVVLRSGLAPKLPPVVADERSLRQIVINLLSNAVKFTDAGGQVIVSTALGDQGEAILRVRDTGIGMDDDEIKLALEPFRQVPTTRRSGGTGLGLPLTKALVEANRAALSITSVKKEGTLVEVTFPPQRVLAS